MFKKIQFYVIDLLYKCGLIRLNIQDHKTNIFFARDYYLFLIFKYNLIPGDKVVIVEIPGAFHFFKNVKEVSLKEISHINHLDEKFHRDYHEIKHDVFKKHYESSFYSFFIAKKRIDHIIENHPGINIFMQKQLEILYQHNLYTNLNKNSFIESITKNSFIGSITKNSLVGSIPKNSFIGSINKNSLVMYKKGLMFLCSWFSFWRSLRNSYDFCVVTCAHSRGPLNEAYTSLRQQSRHKKMRFLTITNSVSFFIKNFFITPVVYIPSFLNKRTALRLTPIKNLNFNKNVILLPHMSGSLQDVFYHLHKDHSYFIGSTPVVTISSSPASTVDWEYLDFIGSTGDIATQSLLDNYVSKEKIFLTGNLALDNLIDQAKKYTNQKNPKIILIATSSYDPHEMLWIEKMVDCCMSMDNVMVVLSPHPSYTHKNLRKLQRKFPKNKFIISLKKDASYWIPRCSVCVTDFSSVGVYAGLLQKKLIVVNLTGQDFPSNRYNDMGVAVLFNAIDDIHEKSMRAIIEKENFSPKSVFQKFVNDYNYKNDGDAANRFLDLFMIESQKQRTLHTIHPENLSKK